MSGTTTLSAGLTDIGSAWLHTSSATLLLLAGSGLAAALLHRSTAAARHRVWALGVFAALALPLLASVVGLAGLNLGSDSAVAEAQGAARTLLGPITAGPTDGLPEPGLGWPAWLMLGWAAGSVLVSLRLIRGYQAAQCLARATSAAESEAWTAALAQATTLVGLGTRGSPGVELRRSDVIRSPMTVGLIRPRILLPAEAERWSPERLRTVLIHELGHVRRRDGLIQLCAQLVCVLHWPNPLAWLAAARLRIEREYACDDLVLGAGVRASSYATDLLAVARGCATDEAARIGALAMAEGASAGARLRRILDGQTPRRPLGSSFHTITGLAAAATALALACTVRPTPGDDLAPTHSVQAAPAPRSLSLGTGSVTDHPSDMPFEFYVSEGEPLDLAPIERALQANLDDLDGCYKSRLQSDPNLRGEISIHWTIASDGEVIEQCITHDTVGDQDLVRCVNELIQTTSFPASPTGPIDVSIPFVFAG